MAEERVCFRSAAFLVLKKDGKILMHKRINTPHEEGNYGLVAGHLDAGETAQRAIVREAKEEAGIIIREEDLRVVHVLHNRSDEEYFNIFMVASAWEGEPKNMEPHRCGDLSWFPVEDLPANTIDYVRSVLENIDKGVFYSTFKKELPAVV